MQLIKRVRNVVTAPRPVQIALRVGARRGIIPRAAQLKLAPVGKHPLSSPAGNRFTYVADLSDVLARSLIWDDLATWERTSLDVFSDLVRNAQLMADVGAYTGIYSLIACADGPSDVIAFEPNPAVIPLLEANLAVNGWERRVTVVPMGVSDVAGAASLAIPSDVTAAQVTGVGVGVPIELVTIDQVIGGRHVDVMKLDVEGLELQALRGASETIAGSHPAIIVETLSADAFNDVQEALRRFGYRRCLHLGSRGPIVADEWIEDPGHANNLWFFGSGL